MNKLYAQLDIDGNVHTVCQLAGEVEDSKLIHVDDMDTQLLRSKYENKKFKKEVDSANESLRNEIQASIDNMNS